MDNIVSLAIKAALENHWQKAVELNKKILQEDPNNVEALNRLAHAYVQLEKYDLACQAYQKVLSLDKYNRIAGKNLKKYSLPHKAKIKKSKQQVIASPSLFLQEPGKTRVINLVNIASHSSLLPLQACQQVFLKVKRYSIEIRDSDDSYIGAIPDNISYQLKNKIENGTRYRAYIKEVTKNHVSIFIKEGET